MAWETRGSGSYYYRKVRIGDRVRSEYIGAGYVAEALAELDDIEERGRRAVASEWRAAVESERDSSAALVLTDNLVRSAVAAVLIANGFHTHNRQWRRKRDD